jgi:paxillin
MDWHPHHLGCKVCGKDFSDGSPVQEGEDGFAYCERDFVRTFSTLCLACDEPIDGACINALGGAFHPEHFVCTACKGPLPEQFFNIDSKPYCEKDYYDAMGLICLGCERPIIVGKCVPFGKGKFHVECWSCSFCKTNLAGKSFKTRTNEKGKEKQYCSGCYVKMFG